MLKFLKKFISFFLVICILSIGLVFFNFYVIGSQYQLGYNASIIDKTNRLKSINEPKIILVGNSNVAFGFNSEIIEKEFNMPVVNLGLHGDLNNYFHEQIAKLCINKGDIVVVCHSSFDNDYSFNSPDLAWITLDNNKDLLPLFTFKNIIQMLPAYPTYFRKSFYMWISGKGNEDSLDCYSRNAFNKYGDVVKKPEADQMEPDEYFKSNPIELPEINDICIKNLNDLYSYCEDKQASLVVAGYPIAYGKYSDFTKQDFDEFQNKLESALDCEIISDYSDYFLPYNLFYNTGLHLTNEGAKVRTEKLIDDLKKWMNKEKVY